MSIRLHCIGLAVALAGFAAFVASARGEVLIQQNFEQADKFPTGPQPAGTITAWEAGEDGPLGSIAVATVKTPTGPTRAAAISNVAHKENRAPGLLLAWPEAKSGMVRVEYRFMTPIDGPFYSVHYFGGSWKTAAAILIMKDGQCTLQYGEKDARISLGRYAPNVWYALRCDFDITARSVDVFLDGKKLANQLPWQSDARTISGAELYAEFTRVDHGGAPVLYVDEITVQTVTPAGAAAPVAAVASPSTQPSIPLKALGRTFRYGVCSHLRRYQAADYDKLLDAIDRLGVDIERDGYDWNALEPAEGAWNFERMDKLVWDLAARGVEMQPLLGFSAKWASTGRTDTGDWHDWNNRAPRLEPFKTYATTMVGRYKDRIHYWEIWNEPEISFWLSTTSEYVDLFNAASAAVMQADPTAKVLNGGFAMERRPPNMNFLQEFLPGAETKNWGIWAYHDYNTFAQMIAREKQNRQYYQSKKLNIPIWINEGGFNTLTRGGEAEQGITLAKKIAAAPSMGIGAYIWYDLIDDGDQPLDPEHHFGLLRRDFSPKPAYLAYQQVIRELAPRKFFQRLSTEQQVPGLWGFVYQSPDTQRDHVLVLWREGKGRQTPLWVGANGGEATAVYAIDGTKVSAPQLEGGMLVTVGDSPVYVRLKGSLDPVIRPFLSLPDKLAILPGHDNPLRIGITNPTGREATFTVSLSADPSSLHLATPQSEAHLIAGQSTTLSTIASLADRSTAGAGGVITVSLHPAAGGPAVEAQLPYVIASAIPKLPDASARDIPAGRGLLLKMDTSDSVVNLFSAEPNPAMHWQGPADLSATARIAYTAEALYLHVIATDDTHMQPCHGAEIWRGDSIQLAVRTDDSRPEYFEAGLALGNDGKVEGWIYTLPPGSPLALGAIDKSLTYDVKREDKQTHYIIRIPWKSLGNDGSPANGLRLNFIINDDDGRGRKGWVQLSDGIGKDKNADLFPLFVCE